MNELITAIPTGITAFVATNLDDLVILTLLFAQANATFRHRHIVIGQYLGFCTLVIASLFGFFGGLILPSHWIGLLGLVPITIGFNRLINTDNDESSDIESGIEFSNSSIFSSFLSPQAYSVAAITIANGSDNVGIYMPLFANSAISELLVIIAVFLLLVGVWCYVTYKLTCQSAIATLLTRYGNNFVPFILIGLGVFIILDSAALTPIVLTVACLGLMGLIKIIQTSKLKTQSL
ncbi:cadmium resistance transporter [Tolypothrix tenuis PCC 7101]|uniref:Cadmium resistance transporter n=1 Tax=Tolypothrix tenuis PCC 7101 TaxID=231146 RepID=A0A1Z4N1Z1_9CYAN|nr:cadmium resistance transporter [Aulosira sp. FACHB-113]BAY99762.1 cadmium resistance transporter [Tolypothrix tenuis PCC 7101]BAZ76316.1 cadmium resistance transporter [Aulosira laxa NIES-50]